MDQFLPIPKKNKIVTINKEDAEKISHENNSPIIVAPFLDSKAECDNWINENQNEKQWDSRPFVYDGRVFSSTEQKIPVALKNTIKEFFIVI